MRFLLALCAVLLVAGCGGMQYYIQAMSGHLDLMRRARPIDELLAENSTSDKLRTKLQRVQSMRTFASKELSLPDNGSYRGYADLERPFVVWNVFAAPEFSIAAKQSCFLFVGCVTYRGYYSRTEAEAYAADLKQAGFDVYIGGVPAYSTLGWFDDPVLSTFVSYPDSELARLIFHELAHQTVFAKGDTTFNESFAVVVEREGLKRWLNEAGTESDRMAYAAYGERRDAFLALVLRYREKLDAWYHMELPVAEKRAGKKRLLAQMEADYAGLKESWGGFAGYDRWFAGGVNNAHLASVAAYTELVPAFEALLEREGHNLPAFYAAAAQLAHLDKPSRDARLAVLSTVHSITALKPLVAPTASALSQ